MDGMGEYVENGAVGGERGCIFGLERLTYGYPAFISLGEFGK